jgi:hypothetical protein
MDRTENNESLMEATGTGLLPGLVGAMTLVVLAMAALLSGSMWAVFGVLALIAVVTAAIVFVVVAVTAEAEQSQRLRALVPGLADPTRIESGGER